MIIGLGLLSLLKSTSQTGSWVGFQLIVSVGSGLLVSTLLNDLRHSHLHCPTVGRTHFPSALAPICGSHRISSRFFQFHSIICNGKKFDSYVAFTSYVDIQTWGITIATTILRNQLKEKLPVEFTNTLPADIDVTFSAISQISGLTEPVKSQVRKAFADSLSVVWKVMIGISLAGMISNLALQEIPMNTITDDNYGLQET